MIGYAGERQGIRRMVVPVDGNIYLLEERTDHDGVRQAVHRNPMFTATIGLDRVRIDDDAAARLARNIDQIRRDYPAADGRLPEEGLPGLSGAFTDADRIFDNYFRWHRNHV